MTDPKAQAQPLTVEFGPETVVSSGVSQDVQQKAEDAKDWAQETTASAAEKAQKLAEDAKQEAAAYWGKIQQQASAALGNAGEEQPLDDQINDQIQQAKEQVSAAMTQLNAQFGRKMLHKHDDEEEDRHHHEEKEAKKAAKKAEKEAKKAAKKAKKEAKHAAEEALDFEPFPTEFDWEMDPELDGPPKPSPECLAAQRSMLAMWGILTISVLLGTIYAARMRTAMRERFGIPGSRVRDFFAWFCCSPCALCQETRTLAANNVHGGVWFGPTVLSAPQPHPMAAPVVQSASKPEGHITKG
jgi:Cys-rich protein (TIGR01571 family)